MQTRFKKKSIPNLQFSVSPYEQGNNHPDSLLRVNSRYNLVNGGISWRLQRPGFQYIIYSMGSSSAMSMSDTLRVGMKNLSIQQDLMVGRGFSAGVTTTFTRTRPGVDSTQSNTWQLRTSWSGKSLQMQLQCHYAQFLSGAYRKGVSFIFGTSFHKNLKISMKAGYDIYHRMWGIYHQPAWSGLLRAEIRW